MTTENKDIITNSTESHSENPSIHSHVIIVYVLMILSAISGGILGIIGVIWAYIKRGDAQGSIYEGHFSNIISTFWITLVLSIVGVVLTVAFIGWLILAASWLYFLFRMIKGIIRAIDRNAYN